MIAVTKDEVEVIRERFPYAHIVRTMKQKSKRHRYFCEEAKPVMRYLAKSRGEETHVPGKRGSGDYANRKKTQRNSD